MSCQGGAYPGSSLVRQVGDVALLVQQHQSEDMGAQCLEKAGALRCVHFFGASEKECKDFLSVRNLFGDLPFQMPGEPSEQISKHFVGPWPREGFSVVLHH